MIRIFKTKKLVSILTLIVITSFSCKDENVLDNLDQNNLQACHDYLLIEKTIIDIEREIEHAFISTQTTKQQQPHQQQHHQQQQHNIRIHQQQQQRRHQHQH